MAAIHWNTPKDELYFTDLSEKDTFRITTPLSKKGAVYMKVKIYQPKAQDLYKIPKYYMLELATGLLFDPTISQLELVDVDINIYAKKPEIYS